MKLSYFPFPGRGETTRAMLTYAGIPFEDVHVSWQDWPSVKPTTPYGSLPMLEVDGVKINQSAAINRYVASLAGLLPSDPLEAAKMDEAICLITDVIEQLQPLFTIKDEEEKLKTCEKIVASCVRPNLDRLERLLATRGSFFGGDSVNFADFAVFTALSNLRSGLFEGVPSTLLEAYPGLSAMHDRVAALPPVAARYEVTWTGSTRAAFQPFAGTA